MLTTDFSTGSPSWIDVSSPDIPSSAAYYGAVFGWSFVSAGPNAGGYGFFQKDGRTVGAIGPLMAEGTHPSWTTFFQTPDAQATAAAVREHGGTVLVEPMDVMGAGWLAQFADPTGARFAVWQPGTTKGLEKASEADSLCWVELHTPDVSVAFDFYQEVFGWRQAEYEGAGMAYTVLSTAAGDPEEATFGGMASDNGQVAWAPYFAVEDTDAAVALSSTNGGTVLMPAADVPTVGRIAWLADPAGASFGVLKPNPQG